MLETILSFVAFCTSVYNKISLYVFSYWDYITDTSRITPLLVTTDMMTSEFKMIVVPSKDTKLYHYFKRESSFNYKKTVSNISQNIFKVVNIDDDYVIVL